MRQATSKVPGKSSNSPKFTPSDDEISQDLFCPTCPLRTLPFCLAAMPDGEQGNEPGVRPRHVMARAHQTIYRKYQNSSDVILMREGWAARAAISGNGRRLIQSFLLPGDLLSTTSIFKERLPFTVQTVTPVGYCVFDREELLRRIESRPESLKLISGICIEDRERCDRVISDLVTRSAEERVVILLLDLFERLKMFGVTEDHDFLFPLTQQQLADALGMTQVHVNRVLRRLREEGLIEFARGVMRFKRISALRSIARG